MLHCRNSLRVLTWSGSQTIVTLLKLVGPLTQFGGVMEKGLSIEPIRKERISQRVALQICSMVRDGTLSAGDSLPPERELASRLSVSRASLREALRGLEIAGIVKTTHGGGTVVRHFSAFGIESPLAMIFEASHDDVSDLWEMRRIVEPALAERAAVRASPEDIEWLSEMLKRHEEPHNSTSKSDVTRTLDREFHSGIARITGNRAADQVIQLLNTLVHRGYQAGRSFILERRQISYAHHVAIFEAIRDGDPVAARRQMLSHLQKVEEFILEELIEQRNKVERSESDVHLVRSSSAE